MGEKRIHLPSVGVAELVGQGLNLIRRQIVVVPEAPVVGRPARTLKFVQDDNDKNICDDDDDEIGNAGVDDGVTWSEGDDDATISEGDKTKGVDDNTILIGTAMKMTTL